MVNRRLVVSGVCCALMLAPAPAGAAFPGNRLVNPGAEDGLAGWSGEGFGLASYDTDGIPRYPAPFFATRPPADLGARVFSAAGDGAISQVVDFSDLAGAIDGGGQALSGGGLLGGRGGRAGGARLVVQPLDAGGRALGAPYVAGPPSDVDRQFKTALMQCYFSTRAPVGMRAALVRLEAVGHGLADRLSVAPITVAIPAVGRPAGVPYRVADGPGCGDIDGMVPAPVPDPPRAPDAAPSPPPALRSLVALPASNRCQRRGPLRFRVQRNWRQQVKGLEVKARGKRIVRGPFATINVAAPRRTLRVAVRVLMRDGGERLGSRRFTGC